jgi:hypothetical protein
MQREYDLRCQRSRAVTAIQRQQTRDEIVNAAGGLNYDRIECDFGKLAKILQWPKSATLKDLRHLFSTCLENAGVSEFYRKYLMGHSLGRAPLVAYTHLNAVRQQYQRALDTELAPVVEAVKLRHELLLQPAKIPVQPALTSEASAG